MPTDLGSRASAMPITPRNLALTTGLSALLVVGSSSGQLDVWCPFSATSANNVAPSSASLHLMVSPVVETAEAPDAVRSPAQHLVAVHQESGLTWGQIARYFGVSRRAVHLWASGGRMTATNEELLAHLVRAVEGVRYLDPENRRQALLRSDAGLNIVDAERTSRSSRPFDINRSPEIGVASDRA